VRNFTAKRRADYHHSSSLLLAGTFLDGIVKDAYRGLCLALDGGIL